MFTDRKMVKLTHWIENALSSFLTCLEYVHVLKNTTMGIIPKSHQIHAISSNDGCSRQIITQLQLLSHRYSNPQFPNYLAINIKLFPPKLQKINSLIIKGQTMSGTFGPGGHHYG